LEAQSYRNFSVIGVSNELKNKKIALFFFTILPPIEEWFAPLEQSFALREGSFALRQQSFARVEQTLPPEEPKSIKYYSTASPKKAHLNPLQNHDKWRQQRILCPMYE
jgi:hypothetical protein